jgi:hypothetical protein
MKITKKMRAEKMEQVMNYERKWGSNTMTRAWRKWCTYEDYRKREEEFRLASRNTLDSKINLGK